MGIWNGPKVSTLIEKYNKTKIVTCILGISRKSYNFRYTNNIAYTSLFLNDISIEEIDNESYGILIEYGNYSPYMSEEEKKNVINGNVIYRYGDNGGLRYYAIKYSTYLKEFGDIGYVEMDIFDKDQMTFSNFIERCAPIDERKWTQNHFFINRFSSNNCQTFTSEALKILKPIFSSKLIYTNIKGNNTK